MKIIVKILNKFFFLIECILRSGFLILAVFAIFALAYFLGFPYLTSPRGTDSLNALTYIYWFDKWFPQIPYWFPLQNGGVVAVWGYPFLAHFIVITIHRLSQVSLVGALQILGFLSVPLTAIGLYFFVWARLKNQTVALIASIFYLLMPLSWAWLFDWGFYAESVSYIFIFPTLIFYDIFLNAFLNKKINIFSRASLLLAILSLSLSFLTHPTTFFIISVSAFALTIVQAAEKNIKNPLNILKNTALPFSAFIILALLTLAFILIDFQNYAKITAPPGGDIDSKKNEFIQMYPTPVKLLLGLEKIPPTEFKFGHRNLIVPPIIWLPAIFGLMFGLIYSRKVFALALLASLPILFFQVPEIAWFFIRYVPNSAYFIAHRAILVFLRSFIPIAGAFGIYYIGRFVFDILTFWLRFIKTKYILFPIAFVKTIVLSVLTLGVSLYLILNFGNAPSQLWSPNAIRYGPEPIDLRFPFQIQRADISDPFSLNKVVNAERFKKAKVTNIKEIRVKEFLDRCSRITNPPDICYGLADGKISKEEIEEFSRKCNEKQASNVASNLCPWIYTVDKEKLKRTLLDINNWPKPKLEKEFYFPYLGFKKFIDAHSSEKNLRIDISPAFGGVVQSLNIISDISMINLYAVQLSLIGTYWGYQAQVFYIDDPNTIPVANMAKYFGTKYVLASEFHKQTEKYEKNPKDWEKVDEQGFYKLKDSPQLYSWSVKKPSILVIGNKKLQAYEPVFRTSVNGALGYDDGILVRGKDDIDDYSLSELKRFKGIILSGYSYKNKGSAYKLLDRYVKDGGSLFISTGWQYVDKDWESKNNPDPLPVKNLVWSSQFNKNSKFRLKDTEIGNSIDLGKFSPLAWEGQGWGVSVPKGEIKDWAHVVLQIDDAPLVVAGTYGKGKVVWSGLNWPGHVNAFNFNKEEIMFLHNVFKWLINSDPIEEREQSRKLTMIRDFPDRIGFNFLEKTDSSSILYWRESYFPDWKATLSIGEKKIRPTIYRAGPGFMLMHLPPINSGDKLVLEFDPGIREILFRLITIITLLFVGIYVILGNKLFYVISQSKILSGALQKIKFSQTRKAGIDNVKKWWDKDNEEKDY